MPTVEAVPAPLDIVCVAGDDLHITIDAAWDDLSPVDWIGGTPTSQVRAAADDMIVGADFLCTPDVDVPGRIVISLTAEQTGELAGLLPALLNGRFRAPVAGFEQFGGVWDIQLVDTASTLTRTICSGLFTVNLDVTRA